MMEMETDELELELEPGPVPGSGLGPEPEPEPEPDPKLGHEVCCRSCGCHLELPELVVCAYLREVGLRVESAQLYAPRLVREGYDTVELLGYLTPAELCGSFGFLKGHARALCVHWEESYEESLRGLLGSTTLPSRLRWPTSRRTCMRMCAFAIRSQKSEGRLSLTQLRRLCSRGPRQ